MESKQGIKSEMPEVKKEYLKKESSDTKTDTAPVLKRKIKTEASFNDDSTNTNKKVKDASLLKIVRSSDVVGQNPAQMLQMLYNKKTKEPFMYSMSLGNNGIDIYAIFKWASENNIQFVYNADEYEIVMYGYKFVESNFEHELVICDDSLGQEAMGECEKQKLTPFNDSQIKTENFAKYDNIIKTFKQGKLLVENEGREMSSSISTNVITYEFINHIVSKMKETNGKIEIMGYYVADFTEGSEFEQMLEQMLTGILSEMTGGSS